MLEIWDGDDPFAELETYLEEASFSGGDDRLVADVFLGYRLSRALRRKPWPDPPEPCRLPLLAARIHPVDEPRQAPGPFAIGDWKRSWDDEAYATAIEAVQAAIGRGDVYQVNLVQHLRAPFRGDPAGLGSRLAPLHPLFPHPFEGNGWAIASGSPELFLARRGDRVWTKPIKGTRPAGARGELRESEKDAAEHVMIVDLERNDLSRVCEPGSVRWPELMAEREMAGVTHMVSTVEGRLGVPGTPGPRVVLARPRCYMNESGGPVKALATFYKLTPEQLVVVHDEIDIPFGTLRVKLGGGDNGHNGLRSLRSALGSGDFYRVRSGVGRPPGRQEVADFVLSNYSTVERKELPFQVDRAADAVESLVADGLAETQQRFNG